MPSSNCGTVTVVEAFAESDVSISCSLGSSEVTEGDTVTVDAEITNDNPRDAEVEWTVTVDGEGIEDLSVTVPAEDAVTESAEVEFTDPGDYEVGAETVSVSSA